MSQKTYSAEEVAKAVLKKCHDMVEMKKSLFNDKCVELKCDAPTKTKESCFWDIKWSVEKLKALKELSWTVESEAPEAKDLFEKEFKKEKAKLSELIAEHKKLKKSENESEDEKNLLAKAEEMDKCGDMAKPMGKSDKLKNFLAKKDKKKALKKAGSMDSLPGSVASTGGPSIASQIGFGKKEVKKARVDEGKSNAEKRQSREKRNDRQIGSDSGNAFGTPKDSVKGVNKPAFRSNNSVAGEHARKEGSHQKEAARGEHERTLRHIKEQKAPNLPKAEVDMAKAKVDQGKTPSQKGDARRLRNDREIVGDPDKGNGQKIVGTPKKPSNFKPEPFKPSIKKEEAVASKAIGLKPIATGAEAPKVDNASKPPKAATTLKSFLAQKKK